MAARKAAELHQEELAQKLNKVQSHVSLIETREREIGVIDLFRWCRATGVRFSDLAREFEEDVERMEREGKELKPDKANPE